MLAMYRAGSCQKHLWDQSLNSSDSWFSFCSELHCNCMFWGSILKFHPGSDPHLSSSDGSSLQINSQGNIEKRTHKPLTILSSWNGTVNEQVIYKMSGNEPIAISRSLETVILLGCWSGRAASIRTWVNQLFWHQALLEAEGILDAYVGSFNNLHSTRANLEQMLQHPDIERREVLEPTDQ
jgi:hypothetical protein